MCNEMFNLIKDKKELIKDHMLLRKFTSQKEKQKISIFQQSRIGEIFRLDKKCCYWPCLNLLTSLLN